MKKSFTYFGNDTVGALVTSHLTKAGYAHANDTADAEVVITYCTSQTALEDAYFDEKGFVQSARPGALLIDLSASTPSFARELNAVAVVSDLISVEAPLVVVDIACPDAFADKKNLMCFVAGDEDGIKEARPFLEAFVEVVQDVGGSGSAQLARAAYTLQTTAQVISAIEADALYRAVHRSSSAPNQDVERVGAATPIAENVLSAVKGSHFEGTYTVEMFMSELSAALTAADDVDLILPQAEACLHLLELLAVIGGADKTPAALALVYDEESTCAEQGLDWTRAEQAYGDEGEEFDEFESFDDGCGCDHDHDHGSYPDYPGYSAYSAN